MAQQGLGQGAVRVKAGRLELDINLAREKKALCLWIPQSAN